MDELAGILAYESPLPRTRSALAQALLRVCTVDTTSVRGWLLTCARRQAGVCECEAPLPRWTKSEPPGEVTCGR